MKKLIVCMSSICILAGISAYGDVTGRISGLVRDQSGAIIPKVDVKAIDTLTGITQSAATNAQGFYAFPALPVGNYTVTFEKSGFRTYQATNLVINVNSVLRVDATMQVGVVTQAVTVSGTALHVETTSTQMGDVISGSHIVNMPLNGRDFTDLLPLQPGIEPTSTSPYTKPGDLSISGQRQASNGFEINGGDVDDPRWNGTAALPDVDAIAEFRVITNNFDAEYGNYSGGIVNVITKSGTNQFHGDAFEFLRNPDFDSRNFYSATRNVLRQNQFGGTFGGPIIHNKAFFFVDYQGTREVLGVVTGNIAVPTQAERNGDFSGLANPAKSLSGTVNGPYWASTLSQELGYPVTDAEPYYKSGCTTTAQCVFPGAIVPQSAFAAPTKHLLTYIPLPNTPTGFFQTSAFDDTTQDDKGSVRVDANSRWGMLSAYYFLDNSNEISPSNIPGFSSLSGERVQQATFSDTKSFGATTVNLFRLSYTRYLSGTFPNGGVGPSLSSLGFTGIIPSVASLEGVPSISLNEFSFGIANGQNQINNTYQVADDFTKVYGTHTLKFGGAVHRDQVNEYTESQSDGVFDFNGTETGLDLADFLIGAPASYIQGYQLPLYTRTWYYGFYGQDSWRARSDLTLNYGLRWEVSTPWNEEHNELETLIPGEQSVVFPGAPLGWLFPGDPGVPPTLSPIRYDNFAPRFGLAYAPSPSGGLLRRLLGSSGKSSFRAGWGLFYTAYEQMATRQEVGDAPFGNYYESPVPPMFANPFIDRATGNNEGQRFPLTFPPLNVSPSHPDTSVNWAKYVPIGSSPAWFHTNQVPYGEDYMFSYERQLGASNLLNVSYVGTQGHRLLSGMEANPGNPALCLSVSQIGEVVPGTARCGPNGENGVYHPITGGVVNGTRSPYPNTIGSNAYEITIGNSNYNALEASFEHKSGRSDFLFGYTWSKALDNTSDYGVNLINQFNPKLSEGLSAYDRAQNFVASYVYEVPFAKLFHASNRLTNGWEVTGITQFATGDPILIEITQDRSLYGTTGSGSGTGIDEPNFTPGNLDFTDPRTGPKVPYFNTALFSNEPLGQLGTANRRFFTGPGLNNWTIGVFKDVQLTESKMLQFRVELFNAFNHTQFNNPVGTFNSSNFGLVTGAAAGRIMQMAAKFYF